MMNRQIEKIVKKVEIGDVIIARNKKTYIVTNITLPIVKNNFTEEGEFIDSITVEPELHLFDIKNKKPTISSYNRLIEENELWIGVGLGSVTKHDEYTLKVEI